MAAVDPILGIPAKTYRESLRSFVVVKYFNMYSP
jgi:hypothetical protein